MNCQNFWRNPFYCGLFFINILLVCIGVIWISLSIIYAVTENEDNDIPDTHTNASYTDSRNFLFYCIIAQLICVTLLVNCFVWGFYFGLYKEGAGAIRMYSIILIAIGIASLIMGVAMCAVSPEGKKTFIKEIFTNYKTRKQSIAKIEKQYNCCSPFPEQDLLIFKYCNRTDLPDCVAEFYRVYSNFGVMLACAAFTTALLSIFTAMWGCYLATTM